MRGTCVRRIFTYLRIGEVFMKRSYIDGYTEWQANPEIVSVNRLPQHATLMPYGSFEEARRCKRYESSRCILLNGKWRFKLYKITHISPQILRSRAMIRIIGTVLRCRLHGLCRAMTETNIATCATRGRAAKTFVRLTHPQKTTPWAVT